MKLTNPNLIRSFLRKHLSESHYKHYCENPYFTVIKVTAGKQNMTIVFMDKNNQAYLYKHTKIKLKKSLS